MRRREFLMTIFGGTASLSVASSPAVSQPSANIAEEVEALLRETEAIWASQDTARLLDLWDRDDPNPFYLAAEQEDWFTDWPTITDYLAPKQGPQMTEAIRVRFYNIQAKLLSDDMAFAAYWMRTDMKLAMAPKPFGSDNRVSAVFRRKPDGWRYVSYAEGFQSPNIYMQKLYELNVSPDYQEFYDETMSKKSQ